MKYLAILLFSGPWALASDHFPLETDLAIFSNEITISDQKLSRQLSQQLDVTWKEADLVADLFFAHDEYLFCKYTPEKSSECSFFLDSRGNGALSSYYRDSDFGKGDVIDALFEKKIKGTGTIYPQGRGFQIVLDQKLSQIVIKKMKRLVKSYEKRGRYSLVKYHGEHLNCDEVVGGDVSCSISLPYNENKGPGQIQID